MLVETTEEQDVFASATARFLESELPLTAVRGLARSGESYDRMWWRQGAELGWTSLLVPEALGGGSVSSDGLADLTILADLFGRHVAPGPLSGCNVVSAALAGAEHHRGALSSLLSGERTAAWCYEGPSGEPSFANVGVIATRSGGDWVINGVKSPVEEAPDVNEYLVVVETDRGVAQVLVPADTPGLRCTALGSLDVVRKFGALTFDGVRIPDSQVVGGIGDDAEVERCLQLALVIQMAESVGAADQVFNFTLEWMFDRYSFGRPLASYQELKHRFADMRMWLEASHATVDACARAVASGDPDAPRLVSVAKSYTGDFLPELVQDCLQMHGGIGVTWEHDIHLYLRRVTQNRALLGTPSEHRSRVFRSLRSADAS